jgi:hypothetical protein
VKLGSITKLGRKRLNLLNEKFERLTVIEDCGNKKGFSMWKCKCSCGNIITTKGVYLKNGHTKSCGCINSERIVKRNKELMIDDIPRVKNRIYRIYWGMKERCYNIKNHNYKYYGKRGIYICDEWLNDFKAFEQWSIENGYSDELSIDRINNDGCYSPENCRWATTSMQNANKRHKLD